MSGLGTSIGCATHTASYRCLRPTHPLSFLGHTGQLCGSTKACSPSCVQCHHGPHNNPGHSTSRFLLVLDLPGYPGLPQGYGECHHIALPAQKLPFTLIYLSYAAGSLGSTMQTPQQDAVSILMVLCPKGKLTLLTMCLQTLALYEATFIQMFTQHF